MSEWYPSLGWLLITLLIYQGAVRIHRAANGMSLLHPLVTTVVGVVAILAVGNVAIADYQQHVNMLHWLLGPATIALAVPMYRYFRIVRDVGPMALVAIAAGGVTAPTVCTLLLWFFDVPAQIVRSGLTKSITTPLAIETTALIGGHVGLATVMVILTGIMGAIMADGVFKLLRCTDPVEQGLALGTSAHVVGTSHAALLSEQASAFSSIALCLNGIATALILPLLFGG